MSDFPLAGIKEDGELYGESYEDNSIKSDTDGGYEFRRPRFTRNLRKVYETGFSMVDSSEKQQLCDFYELKQMHTPFFWLNPVTGQNVHVNFEEFKFDRIGYGAVSQWNIRIKLKEV